MKRRLILLAILTTLWLTSGCRDQPSPTSTDIPTIIHPTDTPKPTEVPPTPKPLEGRPAWLPTPPENPTIVQLTDNPGWQDEMPVWSPDGSQILFMSNRECVKQYDDDEWDMKSRCWKWDLYLINADGSNEIRLTDVQFVDGWNGAWLRWSPDSKRIAFTYSRFLDKPFEIVYAFSVERAKQEPLSLDEMEVLVDKGEEYLVGSFEWSPDGEKFAYDYSTFSVEYPNDPWNIVITDEDSGEEEIRKTIKVDTICRFEAWSLGSEGLLITCKGEENSPCIYWGDLRGKTERLLIQKGNNPIWSPDGKWIVYYSTASHNMELFHVGSGELIKFLNPAYYFISYKWSWSPDGKWLAFSDFVEGNIVKEDIYLLDMSWLEMEWD